MERSLARIEPSPPVAVPDPAVLRGVHAFVHRSGIYTQLLIDHVPCTLFLGRLYPPGSDMSPFIPLAEIPSQVERRSQYVKQLSDAMDAEPEGTTLNWVLRWERMIWEKLYREELAVRVLARIEKLDPDHMLWRGMTNRSGTPVVSIFAVHDVPVYRVLWPLYKPRDPLPIGRIPKRTPNCPLQGLSALCVHPLHYYVPEPTMPAPHLRTKRGMVDGRPTKMHEWYEHPVTHKLMCKDCGGELGERMQYRWLQERQAAQAAGTDRMGWVPDRLHCPTCYARRREVSGQLGTQLRGSTWQHERKTLQEHYDWKEFFERNAWRRSPQPDDEV
jgi:hypothetical protein